MARAPLTGWLAVGGEGAFFPEAAVEGGEGYALRRAEAAPAALSPSNQLILYSNRKNMFSK